MEKSIITSDKVSHFLAGFTISTLFTIFSHFGVWIIVPAIVAGVLKEVYDKYIRHTYFDWVDLLVTFMGGFGAYFFTLIPKW